jgi:hypothetical protein
MKLVVGKQRAVLRELKAHPEGLTAHELVPLVGASGPIGVAGYIGGGLHKNVPKAGFELGDILVTNVLGKVRRYLPGPALKANEVPHD